jgi:aminoglycoside phosphotransferase (APT) family kinase protein
MSLDVDVLHGQLERWAGSHYHEGVTVADLRAMPGHAGLSFGFTLADSSGVLDRLVMRMPPKGVRRSGNTDVLRQVPLLRALAANGVPVAEVRWWDADEQWFGVPFFMVGLLPGSTFAVRDPDPSFAAAGVSAADVLGRAIDGLAQVHAVDWTTHLADWQAPVALETEVRFWDPLLAKSADPAWVELGQRTRDLLLARMPVSPDIGIFHGDFQTNNLLFDGGELVAILDWEISGIGAQLLDVGWLLMMNDPSSWFDGEGLVGAADPELLVARYAAAIGRRVTTADLAWYRALAGYRFGVISCFNVMLHRSGKRPDAEWDRIAPSVPFLFGRAAELLGDGVG